MALSYVTSNFPAGLEQAGFELTTRLRVFDALDAERVMFSDVVVKTGEKLTAEGAQQYFDVGVVNASGYAG
jgi:hypothetical protein